MEAWPLLLEFQQDFAAAIGEPAAGAMSVYRNTVLSGCVDALRANYQVVEQILGSDMFEAVAVDRHRDLHERRHLSSVRVAITRRAWRR